MDGKTDHKPLLKKKEKMKIVIVNVQREGKEREIDF